MLISEVRLQQCTGWFGLFRMIHEYAKQLQAERSQTSNDAGNFFRTQSHFLWKLAQSDLSTISLVRRRKGSLPSCREPCTAGCRHVRQVVDTAVGSLVGLLEEKWKSNYKPVLGKRNSRNWVTSGSQVMNLITSYSASIWTSPPRLDELNAENDLNDCSHKLPIRNR